MAAVARFVFLHLGYDGPARRVAGRQGFQMFAQVRLDLTLGFDDEAKAHFVADQGGDSAEREAARIPERVEQAGAAVQRVETARAPSQMVGFFRRRLEK